jgi:hypothetical protein
VRGCNASLPSMTVFLYICDYFKISPMEFFDEQKEYPQEIQNVVLDLQKLNGGTLSHVAHIVHELAGK